jgi:hypothetical protein
MTLRTALEECEDDTRRLIGVGAAYRLAAWRKQRSESDLIKYVRKLIRGKSGSNGHEIHRKGGLSLERIVLEKCPELFNDDDKAIAGATLGLPGRA